MTFREIVDQGRTGICSVKPVEVWAHTKNISVIVDVEGENGQRSRAIYYPERGVRLTTDVRIPKPHEVHHHIAYFRLNQLMGLGVAIPASPFSLKEGDCGALSPFYESVEVKPPYFFKSLKPDNVWFEIAVLDYLAGLVDRTSGDVLFLPNGEVRVTDNGLSFVEGTNFATQISVIRKALRGQKLPEGILEKVDRLNPIQLQSLSSLIYNSEQALESVMLRRKVILDKQVVV